MICNMLDPVLLRKASIITGFSMPMVLSAELAELMGETHVS